MRIIRLWGGGDGGQQRTGIKKIMFSKTYSHDDCHAVPRLSFLLVTLITWQHFEHSL